MATSSVARSDLILNLPKSSAIEPDIRRAVFCFRWLSGGMNGCQMLEKINSPTDKQTGPQEHLGGYVIVQHRNHNWNLLGFCETEQDARALAKSHAVGLNAGNIIILPTLGWYTAAEQA